MAGDVYFRKMERKLVTMAAGSRVPSACDAGVGVSCAATLPSMESGRRVYIHQDSLADLAAQSEIAADLVFGMLGRITVIKITHHTIDDSITLGEISDVRGAAILAQLTKAWSANVAETLRQVVVLPSRGVSGGSVIESEEEIVATCYFSNYYTFATDDDASRAMFADTSGIRTIRELQAGGAGYATLKLINGRCLMLAKDARAGKGRRRLPSSVVEHARAAALRDIRSEFESLLLNTLGTVDPVYDSLAHQLRTILSSAFSHGVLKISTEVSSTG